MFSRWFRGEYLSRYPTPPRDRAPVTAELAARHGLVFRGEEEFSDEVGMTVDRFTDYQLSTTNVIAAVREGRESFKGAARWIRSSVEPAFADASKRELLFVGKSWHAEKPAA